MHLSLTNFNISRYKLLRHFNPPPTCSSAQFDITNLTPSDGVTSGALTASGSYNYVIKVPTGMSSLDLRFEYQDATSGKTFYIDNILVKKIDETTLQTLATVINEDFSTASNWVAKNTAINYSGANMQVSKGAASSGVFSATKNLNLTEGQLYKITFDVTGLSMGTSSLSMALENDNTGFTLLDYSTAMNHTSAGSYTYYVTPKTNKARIIYNVLYTSGTFSFAIDNFKIDNIGAALQPMYTSTINALHDYYAFGSPMPGRKDDGVGSTYRYGFNGKERDPELVSTGGNTYDYGFRIYNPSLGKFLSVDPLTRKYPWYTPYQFAGNIPTKFIDVDGLEPGSTPTPNGGTKLKTENNQTVFAPNTNPNLVNAPVRSYTTITGEDGIDFRRASDEEVKRAAANNFANGDVFYVPDRGTRDGKPGEYFWVKPVRSSASGYMSNFMASGNIYESSTSKYFSSTNRMGITNLKRALAEVASLDHKREAIINIYMQGSESNSVLNNRANEIKQQLIDMGLKDTQIKTQITNTSGTAGAQDSYRIEILGGM